VWRFLHEATPAELDTAVDAPYRAALHVSAAAARAVADDIKNGRAAESVGDGGSGGLYLEGIGSLLAELEMFWCFFVFFLRIGAFFLAFFFAFFVCFGGGGAGRGR
jgi:hypothetical protein